MTTEHPIQFRCPHCAALLGAAATMAGKTSKCPSCGKLIEVPAATKPAEGSPKPR